jgi:hypothetical protein
MTKRVKKLTTYQRGVIALREEREEKGIAARERVAAARESWRDYQADVAVREARHNAAMIADAVHQAREQASRDSAGLAALISWKIAFLAIILALFLRIDCESEAKLEG